MTDDSAMICTRCGRDFRTLVDQFCSICHVAGPPVSDSEALGSDPGVGSADAPDGAQSAPPVAQKRSSKAKPAAS